MKTFIKSVQLFLCLVIISSNAFSTAFSVTSIADSGPNTLRQAIINANADMTSTTGAPHLITFSGAGIGQINLLSSLPAITNHISINGGTLGNVVVNGGNTGAIPQAFLFNAAACSGSVLKNLVINNCGGPVGAGVLIQSPAVSVTVNSCRIGTNAAGTASVANQVGIEIDGSADGGHTITNNIVSGNVRTGIQLSNTINNVIRGNYVGLANDGVTVLANTGNGIYLNGSCNYNTLDKNVVSGNTGGGILLSGSSHNTLTGNYCGTDYTGLVAKGNQWDGIGLIIGSNYNTIGGTTVAARNVCSGGISAISSGIAIKSDVGAPSSNNLVLNNYCGVGSDGTTALGNANYGIYLGYTNAPNNVIGKPGYGNVVANNAHGGIYLENAGTANNSIRGNSIFCNGPGTPPPAGQANIGIALNGTANNNTPAPVIDAGSTNGNVYGSGLSAGDTVDVYYTDACRGCTYPNGKTYIGTAIANASGAWSYTGGVTVGSNITATVTKYNASSLPGNTSQFSNCFVSIPMPIDLLGFNVTLNGQSVYLNWTTVTETNNSYFEIQRSTDGVYFNAIGKVNGAGQSSAIVNYNFTDSNPGSGIVYYRLKQVDFDGNYTYSSIQSVDILSNENVLVYPTPVHLGDDIHVELFNVAETNRISIQVVDLVGKIVLAYSGTGSIHTLTTAQLSKGMYLVMVKNAGSIITTKVLVN